MFTRTGESGHVAPLVHHFSRKTSSLSPLAVMLVVDFSVVVVYQIKEFPSILNLLKVFLTKKSSVRF